MCCSKWKTALVLFLACSVGLTQVASGFSGKRQSRLRVAFIGILFRDMPVDVQKRILRQMTEMLEEEPSLRVVKPAAVEKAVGKARVTQTLANPDSASFASLAEELGVDYVFAGDLANQARDSNRILLVGNLYRFDRAPGLFNRYEVLKYYDRFEVELLRFQQQYVKTLAAFTRKHTWPWLVLAGVGVAGLVALTLVSTKRSGEGKPPVPPIRP